MESLDYVTRKEWVAQPPLVPEENLTLPVHNVILTETDGVSCKEKSLCNHVLRYIQMYNIESSKKNDVIYNFVISGNGAVYIGRGWNYIGSHTNGYNNDSICIAFFGKFNKYTPDEEQLNAAKTLIQVGIILGKIDKNYNLFGQRQLIDMKDRPLPGEKLYNIIKKWPHWKNSKDKQLIIENGYRFIDRTQWAARPEKLSSLLKLPVHKVIITHSATDACFTRLECVNVVKAIQDFHMDGNKWDDIGYNFLVSGDGDIYIGRGWDKLGSHTKGYNVESVCVTFIGTFTNQLPTLEQVNTAKLLIKIGVILGKIDKDYELYGHRQLISTDSPGAGVYNIIKTWPHWIDTSKKSNDTEITNI
ncbi:peptidoglycan recognition protein 3-like [Lycorma delicatula]|uniref:peptidoglycan recognition protein 3-like n=1 Tax=Lycorma delicatula TaxID=130591 RepID=UPI003F50FB2E